MTTSTIVRFLFGNADAIRKIAESKSALGIGMILVLLTAIARNYDQTFILEKPFLWLLGPLLFSIGSATFIYCIIYVFLIRWRLDKSKRRFFLQYRSFLGLFWMTAPIAWLYAIPVERFLDSYPAAQMNLLLLAIVSLWRVLLMARVLSVILNARFRATIFWVLAPACAEIFALAGFGSSISQGVLATMGGMRNSPEENLILVTMSRALVWSFFSGPAFLIAAFVVRPGDLTPFPSQSSLRIEWKPYVYAAAFWIVVAVYPQVQLARNVEVEKLAKAGEYKNVMLFLSRHEPNDFAPSRTIPPKPYEYEIYEELPEYFNAMNGTEPRWVMDLYLDKFKILLSHYRTEGQWMASNEIYSAISLLHPTNRVINPDNTNTPPK